MYRHTSFTPWKRLQEYISHMRSAGRGELWGLSSNMLNSGSSVWPAGGQRDLAFNQDSLFTPGTSKIFAWFFTPQGGGRGKGSRPECPLLRSQQLYPLKGLCDLPLTSPASESEFPAQLPQYAVLSSLPAHVTQYCPCVCLSPLHPERTLKAKPQLTTLSSSQDIIIPGRWVASGTVCPMDGWIHVPLSVSVVWFKGGPRSAFIGSTVYLEKPLYPHLFVSKLRKLNSIFLLFNILYIINTNFLQPL